MNVDLRSLKICVFSRSETKAALKRIKCFIVFIFMFAALVSFALILSLISLSLIMEEKTGF